MFRRDTCKKPCYSQYSVVYLRFGNEPNFTTESLQWRWRTWVWQFLSTLSSWTSRSTTSTWPSPAARCSGVSPYYRALHLSKRRALKSIIAGTGQIKRTPMVSSAHKPNGQFQRPIAANIFTRIRNETNRKSTHQKQKFKLNSTTVTNLIPAILVDAVELNQSIDDFSMTLNLQAAKCSGI